MGHSFIYQVPASRVVFGAGSMQRLPDEIEALGAKAVLVLSTPQQEALANEVALILGTRAVGVYARAVMHVPVESAREAQHEALRLEADCAVAVGGGSTTGLGKAIALESGLPIVAIPTTYAGSEMTPIYGLTEAGVKKTGRDIRVLPKTVIYDPLLTLELPLEMSITSALNAMAHAAEGLYAQDANPIMNMMAAEGISACAAAISSLSQDPADLDARSNALYGAWLCGAVLGNVSMGLHHKLCHTLGGSFNLPHAAVHTVILPHALAYNCGHAPVAMQTIAQSLGASGAASGVFDLAKRYGAPLSLKEIGMPGDGLDQAADLAVRNQYPNPRSLERDAIRELLQNAYDGKRPD